ncbi:uncharacterized protein HD556DRAFT_1450817 [Suillus plorans]|uniref:DUF6533 domain-containing protein n=1 Tax=Suillus plorans TaxID=116603 RepID=A0A9P7D9M2_9AGAM|nr:uncharacterized protein HD556DRAFT_1450817 [Suillus plorans]KAG1785310.1 hypothetical protein HD556DRAFT_1450817 [Suillus plorans]
MATVSNDPNAWPQIKLFRFYSYFVVASFAAIIYEWVLTLGQEIELVWTKRWSLMTILYLSLRCTGIIFTVYFYCAVDCPIGLVDGYKVSESFDQLVALPNITTAQLYVFWKHESSLLSFSGTIIWYLQSGTSVVANAVLGVIIIIRLHAMYERSRKMLAFLVVFLLVSTIIFAVIAASSHVSGEEIVFYETHQCSPTGGSSNLATEAWGLSTAWELTTLCLAVWVVVKYLRELKQPLARLTLGNYFRVLLETHAFYFTAYAAVACLNLGSLSPSIGFSLGGEIYYGILQLAQVMQMFVLGPRLILSIREYHDKEMTRSDERTDTSTMVFQGRTQKSTGSSV